MAISVCKSQSIAALFKSLILTMTRSFYRRRHENRKYRGVTQQVMP